MRTASGEVERYIYFVVEGVQRAYSINKNDKDVTLVFTYPPSFSGAADSFYVKKRHDTEGYHAAFDFGD